MQQRNELLIVPVIVGLCDWLSTPFKQFKALPKDGKPIMIWDNQDNALQDVAQQLRKLLKGEDIVEIKRNSISKPVPMSRNYLVQKHFDSIEKMEFVENTFSTIKERLNRYIKEITQLDNIKVRVLKDQQKEIECLLVNRNKIDAESPVEGNDRN